MKSGAKNPSGVLEKINECGFFLDLMSSYEHSGQIKSLLYCLSAFLSAFRSIIFRLSGVTSHPPYVGAKTLLKAYLQAHPQVTFLRDASNVEVHEDGVTVWPQFRLGDYAQGRPGPLELHFFPQMASQVRVVGLRLQNQKSDLHLLEYCRNAVSLLEDFMKKHVS